MATARPEYPVLLLADAAAWEAWLAEHHASAPGVWLRFAKKGSALVSVDYAQALDVALCWGWIDGQVKKFDDDSYLQKFTPRGKKSLWSKVNVGKVERLVEGGRMRAPGQAAVDAAKADGRWGRAYDSSATATVPDDLGKALAKSGKAEKFFATLDRANRYAVIWRVQTATTPATRAKRIATLVAMLERGETIH
jgi:uncharacterized protein YdeI (YjbR/CyaY-like superfamily)